MRSAQHLIPALEQITERANDILDSLPTVDLVTIAVILQACDGDLERAAQMLVNLHVKKLGREILERIQQQQQQQQ